MTIAEQIKSQSKFQSLDRWAKAYRHKVKMNITAFWDVRDKQLHLSGIAYWKFTFIDGSTLEHRTYS